MDLISSKIKTALTNGNNSIKKTIKSILPLIYQKIYKP